MTVGGFRVNRHLAIIVIFLLIFAFPLVYRTPYFLNGMVTAGYNALLALGLAIVLGQAGLLSFGSSAFAGVGAYTAAILIDRLNWPTLAAAAAGIVLSGVVALIIGKPVLRFKLYFLALATMGLATIFTVFVLNVNELTSGINGMAGLPFLTIFGFEFSLPVLAAPIGGVSFNMGGKMSEEDYIRAKLAGCAAKGSIGCTGDGVPDFIHQAGFAAIAGLSGRGIPFVKPWEDAELFEKLTGTAVDSPLCMTCGTKMRPAGSCYVCEGCGSTSGCS